MENKTATKASTAAHFDAVGLENRRTVGGVNRGWSWLAAICVVALGVYLWATHRSAPPVHVVPAVPVSAAAAKSGNLDIYLNQIGTVTPFATVTVRGRVAGQIMQINFTEGQMVNTNQLLMTIDPRPYQAQLLQYEGQLARDQATLDNARITLARYRALFTQGVIAQQDLDNQQALYAQAQGAIENDKGLIDGVKVNLAYCRVVSPIRGRIGLRQVDLGNDVQATDPLVVITQLQPISVIFSVPEDNIGEIVRAMKGGRQVPVQAWDRDMTKQIATGFLLTFDNEIDQTTGTVKLRAQFDNSDDLLFPDQFVNARLLIKTLSNTVLIPTAAVQRSQAGSYVYVVQANKTVARHTVTISATQGDVTAIGTGISDGDVVVTDGLDRLLPGSTVAVRMDTAPKAAATPVQG